MSRRATATIRTSHDDPDLVARALRPDDTDEMETVVDHDEGTVVTRIERETTGGLHSNVDDYVVNLEVAVDVARTARRPHTGDEPYDEPTDAGRASDREHDTATNNNE